MLPNMNVNSSTDLSRLRQRNLETTFYLFPKINVQLPSFLPHTVRHSWKRTLWLPSSLQTAAFKPPNQSQMHSTSQSTSSTALQNGILPHLQGPVYIHAQALLHPSNPTFPKSTLRPGHPSTTRHVKAKTFNKYTTVSTNFSFISFHM